MFVPKLHSSIQGQIITLGVRESLSIRMYSAFSYLLLVGENHMWIREGSGITTKQAKEALGQAKHIERVLKNLKNEQRDEDGKRDSDKMYFLIFQHHKCRHFWRTFVLKGFPN